MPAHGESSFTQLFSGDPMVRHQFDRLAQRRVILLAVPVRRARVHQFLHKSGMRQREAQRSRRLQRKVQILLMQLNAKAGVEGTLDHAFTVNLKDSRRGESSHQRLSHLGRVCALLGSEQQGFGYRLPR